MELILNFTQLVGGYRIHQLHLCRGVITPLKNKFPGYYIKLYDGEALVLEFEECGVPLHCHYYLIHSDLEWKYLLGSMDQIELLSHLLYVKPFNYTNKWSILNEIIDII